MLSLSLRRTSPLGAACALLLALSGCHDGKDASSAHPLPEVGVTTAPAKRGDGAPARTAFVAKLFNFMALDLSRFQFTPSEAGPENRTRPTYLRRVRRTDPACVRP